MSGKFVSYVRVSTQRQGQSGLGLEAQRQAITDFLTKRKPGVLLAEYREIESGKVTTRPELARALADCKARRATLVIAKLDRLSRNSHFLTGLLESGVDVVFCDLPESAGPQGRFLVGVLAEVAQLEAALISQRTRAALQAAKARGVKLGNPNLRAGDAATAARAIAAKRAKAAERLEAVRPFVMDARAAGAITIQAICDKLNAWHCPSPYGSTWRPGNLHRVLARLDAPAVLSDTTVMTS
jgi:DNA invertase Pin-like site-specific DNA recombinase